MNALCQMTGLSRAGFYRWRVPHQASPVAMELRDEMQKVALESPAYGYRRITHDLQQRHEVGGLWLRILYEILANDRLRFGRFEGRLGRRKRRRALALSRDDHDISRDQRFVGCLGFWISRIIRPRGAKRGRQR